MNSIQIAANNHIIILFLKLVEDTTSFLLFKHKRLMNTLNVYML